MPLNITRSKLLSEIAPERQHVQIRSADAVAHAAKRAAYLFQLRFLALQGLPQRMNHGSNLFFAVLRRDR